MGTPQEPRPVKLFIALLAAEDDLDPGYVDAGKVVLASTKGAGHRMYLQAGIYGETTLLFYDGSFYPFPYTYRDYLWPETITFLTDLRARYFGQVKR